MADSDSILQTTKKLLGIDPSYTTFDLDIIAHINTAIATLADIGVGPTGGYEVVDDTDEWSAYLDADPRSLRIKSYIYLYVRRLFDPPATGFLSTSIDKQLDELIVRLSYQREETVT